MPLKRSPKPKGKSAHSTSIVNKHETSQLTDNVTLAVTETASVTTGFSAVVGYTPPREDTLVGQAGTALLSSHRPMHGTATAPHFAQSHEISSLDVERSVTWERNGDQHLHEAIHTASPNVQGQQIMGEQPQPSNSLDMQLNNMDSMRMIDAYLDDWTYESDVAFLARIGQDLEVSNQEGANTRTSRPSHEGRGHYYHAT